MPTLRMPTRTSTYWRETTVAGRLSKVVTWASSVLETVTRRLLSTAKPESSSARALTRWLPRGRPVASRDPVKGAEVAMNTLAEESSQNLTWRTETLSAAFTVTGKTPRTEAPGAGEVMERVGDCASRTTV